jgi:hypothetical protein
LSILLIWLVSSNKKNIKVRLFKFFAVLSVFLIGIPIIDAIVRIQRTPRYVETGKTYHRPPDQNIKIRIEDVPKADFHLPVSKDGYPSFDCSLTVDSRGFRNQTAKESCDVLTIGDSFVEGSRVSDEDIWPALLEKETNLSVYNIGMSGSSPLQYCNNFSGLGITLKPKYLICMLYEGNDFRDPPRVELDYLEKKETNLGKASVEKSSAPAQNIEIPKSFSKKMRDYFKSSPFIIAGKKILIDKFGAVNLPKSSEPEPMKGLSWLPFAFPEGEKEKYYTFEPKRFLSFYFEKEKFLSSNVWKYISLSIVKMKSACDKNGIRMIVVYAPTAANVILPAIAGKVPPGEFYDFMSLKAGEIPPKSEIYADFLAKSDVIETSLVDFSKEQKFEFIDLKSSLREKMEKGDQCYFTYDQHWSPDGHKLVSEIISKKIKEMENPNPSR